MYDLNGTSSEEESEEECMAEEQETSTIEAETPEQPPQPQLPPQPQPQPPPPPIPLPQQPLPQQPPQLPNAAPGLPQSTTKPKDALPSSSLVRVVLHETLVNRYPNMLESLIECSGPSQPEDGSSGGGSGMLPVDVLPATCAPALPPFTVHWTRNSPAACAAISPAAAPVSDRLPRACAVWESAEVVRCATSGTLRATISAAQEAWRSAWLPGCTLGLIVVGKTVAGLERCIDAVQLEAGVACRRATSERELCELLTLHGQMLCASEKKDGASASVPTFLAGLTSSDILHNKGVPKSLPQAWLGALKQILPEAHATAVHQAYPSFRRLYAHLKRSEAEGGRPEGCLAELRVQGGKRLGPARAKRLARVLMATREQADDLVL